MRRSFHWKRLLLLLAVSVVLGGSVFALNKVQARRQSSIIKTVAEKAESGIDGDADRRADAINHYAKYLKFNQLDEESNLKYARLLIDQYRADPSPKNTAAAIQGTEAFLRKFPEHATERRDVADIYIKLGRTRNAREHIAVLFNSPKGNFKRDTELLEMSANCEAASGEIAAAIKNLEDAIATEEAPVRVYEQILHLLNGSKTDPLRESKIGTHIRTLTKKDGRFYKNLEARIAVARFELFRHEYENAHGDIEFARTQIPGGENNADVLFAAAEWEMANIHRSTDVKPRLAAARTLLEKAFAIDPTNVQVGLYLADIQSKQGERALAIETLRKTAQAFGPIKDSYWVLIDYAIDLQNSDLSTSLLERASAGGREDPRLVYFRGRLALLSGDYMKARALLEEAAPNLVKLPLHHKRAMVELGSIYATLQNPDQQLNCYRSALVDDGTYLPALRGEADSLAKLGRLDEAIARYQSLVTAYQIVDLRPTLARLRLLDMIRKPSENRNWEKFDSDDTLGPPAERTGEILALYAQGLAIRGEKDKAVTILNEALKSEKEAISKSAAWLTLVRIQGAGKPEAALNVLDDAEKVLGDTVDLRLARAELLILRAKPPTEAEFEAIGSGAQKFTKFDQYRLWLGLGENVALSLYRFNEGDRRSAQDAAFRYLRAAAEAEPRDLRCRAKLIDLALTFDRKDNLQTTIDELVQLEGIDGPINTLARVSIRLADVKKIQSATERASVIKELREQTKKVQAVRRGWGRVYVALGLLDELEGLMDQAVEHYRQAINEGDRDVAIIRKAVAIYRLQKQDGQAANMLDELSTKMVLPEELERFRTLHEMVNRTIPRSERPTIERIAPFTSTDSKILLLRGSLLAALREDADALKAFRRAIELAEDDPETWESLIRQLVRTGDLAGARQAMKEAERKLLALPEKSKASKSDLLITLGECQELCSDMKAAGVRYREALEVAPKELNPNRRLVEFFMRLGQRADAEKLLAKLAEDSAQDLARWARRYLGAYLLMSRPDAYQQRTTALALIEKNLAAAPNDPDDLKARAIIQTNDPATREEGVRVLKEFYVNGQLNPDECFRLGTLIYSIGPSKIPEAVKYFESAARPRPEVTWEHIAGLIRVYLATDKIEAAEATLERLKAVAPNGWETTREEARLLFKKSQNAAARSERDLAKKLSDDAREAILKFPSNDSADFIRTKSGPLLAELGFNSDAEVLFRKLIALSDSPTAYTPLAILFIQTKKSAEAIQLAREFESKSPVLLTAQILSGAARVKRPPIEVEKQVEEWLDRKIAAYEGKPEHAGLVAARAGLFDAQEKWPQAIAEYRRSIAEAPSDTAINNLAMLLALFEPKKADEAVKLISGVIDVSGPVPGYLDTRAVAYIVQGGSNIDKAIEDLKMARLQHPRAVYAYHLAWAYDLQLKRGEKEKLLEEARRIGIEIDDVHIGEREIYLKLLGPDPK